MYRHLLDGHEVCALADTLKDLRQVRIDEGVVWGDKRNLDVMLFPDVFYCVNV